MPLETPVCDFGTTAPDFALPGTDGRIWTRQDIRGRNGLLVMFICNHCPYVKAIVRKIVRDARDLQEQGIGVCAICSNDAAEYPDDSFERMAEFKKQHGLPFPYLHDESQEIARAYGAVCTPDFFGFDADLGLQYRGRLDASGRSQDETAQRELFEAMKQVAQTGKGPEEQTPSMGCSIKWKQAA